VDGTPAYQSLAEELRTRIVSGRLRPGDRLPAEPRLCESTGLSRSTVREALRLLASQHLITTTRGVTGGSFVARPTPAALSQSVATGLQMLLVCGPVDGRHVFEIRELVEVPAAGLAAERRSAVDVAALRATLCDGSTAGLDERVAAHRAFHTTLIAAADNPVLELISRPLYDVANERDLVSRAPAGFWSRADAEHRAIVDAVATGDVMAARRAAADHLARLRADYAWTRAPAPAPASTPAPAPASTPAPAPASTPASAPARSWKV
jgi:GntR family transcriptional regulator, transcriptional repressor for pyruvate dehydrogenase complex